MKWAVVTLNKQSIKLAKELRSRTSNQVDIFTLEKYLDEETNLIEGGLRSLIKYYLMSIK